MARVACVVPFDKIDTWGPLANGLANHPHIQLSDDPQCCAATKLLFAHSQWGLLTMSHLSKNMSCCQVNLPNAS